MPSGGPLFPYELAIDDVDAGRKIFISGVSRIFEPADAEDAGYRISEGSIVGCDICDSAVIHSAQASYYTGIGMLAIEGAVGPESYGCVCAPSAVGR